MLGQQTPENCPGKTASTDEQRPFSAKIHSSKVLTNKSHFRSIAPKMTPAVIPSSMLTSHPTSLPDVQTSPMSVMNPKPLVMPTQNYALMQVAGQEGTFSLVALPQVPPPVAGQQQRASVPDNLKLPIPRYQSARKKFSENNATRHSTPGASGKTVKPKVCAEAQLMTIAPVGTSESSNEIASENVLFIDSGPTEVTDTSFSESDTMTSASGTGTTIEIANASSTGLSELEKSYEPVIANSLKQNALSVKRDGETTKDSTVGFENTGEKVESASVVNLSAMFGNAVQIIPFPLAGKFPILPYSGMQNTVYSKSEESSDIMDVSVPLSSSDSGKVPSLRNSNMPTKDADKPQHLSSSQIFKPTSSEGACRPAKCDVENYRNPKVGTGKRRGRKRKLPDGILSFQSKRKMYNCKKPGESKDQVKVCSQESGTEAFKKYRNIMPKPLVLAQTLPSVKSSTLVQATNRDCAQQEIRWDDLFAKRAFFYEQTDDISSKQGSKPWHKCHVCNRNFQFKHHLQDHMNTHMNRRPYSCRLCRKAYVHSGSLSTHMKLHHSESRLKKLIPCEFCSKVFGHVRVYFGHLKEVHRVIIGSEVTTAQQELGETVKKDELMVVKVKEESTSLERENISSIEDEFLESPAGQNEVKLQIKCGRCQLITQTFSDMKFHLLCNHGEEIQGQRKEGVLQTSQCAQEELLKHAALYWKQLNERRNMVKCGLCDEELFTFPKLKKHMYLYHPNSIGTPVVSEIVQSGSHEPVNELHDVDFVTHKKDVQFWCNSGLNCVLCKQMFARKEDLFSHWQTQHNCEEPSVLWTIFSSYFEQDK